MTKRIFETLNANPITFVRRWRGTVWFSLIAFVLFSVGVFAEEGTDAPPKTKTENSAPADNTQDAQKDPTSISANLKKALRGDPKPAPVEKAPAPPKIPDVALKAIVQAEGKAATALVEIDGKQQYTVKAGMKYSIKGADGRALTMVIKSINEDGVEIEIPELKETITSH